MLLPYALQIYGWASSGVFTEGLSAGKVLVVPEPGWQSRQLAQYRAGGVTFADQDVGSMVAALNRAVREFDGLRAKSVSASAAWRARHCPSSFVDQLLGLSLMAGGADPI